MLRPSFISPLATSILTLLIAGSAPAATLVWDADGTAGNPVGGTGTWTNGGLNWSDGGAQQTWLNSANHVASFGGDTAGTVTLESPFVIGGLAFETAGYVLTGQSLHLGIVGDNTIAANADATINSTITGDPTASLTISGAGTLTLSGVNTYAGPTSVLGTTLVINNFGSAAGGNLGTIGQITLSGATVKYTGSSFSTDRTVIAGGAMGGGTLEITEADTTVSLTGRFSRVQTESLTKNGPGTLSLEGTVDNNGGRVVLNSGKLILAKTSSTAVHAVASLGGSDYAVAVNDGLVQLAGTGGDQIYFQSAVQMNGGTFDMNGRSEAFSQLTGSGGTVLNSAAATVSTLTLGENNGTSTYGGVLADGAGTLAFAKVGTGTFTLAGANTYTGGTTINGGTVLAPTVLSLPGHATAGKIVVNSGGTVAVRVGGVDGWQATDLQALRASATFNAGAGLGIDTTNGDFTYSEVLSGDLAFSKLGPNSLLLSGANSHTAGTSVSEGTLKLGSATAFGTGPATISGGSLDLNGFSIETPMLSGPGGEVTNSSATDATVTINLGANNSGNFAGLLSTTSTGKLHLVINTVAGGTASNFGLSSFSTFLGSVRVNGVGNALGTRGVLGIAMGGSLGDPSNVLTLNDGGTLANMYNPTTTGSWPNYAAPAFVDNPVVLTGTAGGVLRAGYVNNGGGLVMNGVISGPGNLTKTDGGYVELTADNTYEGTTTIAAGTLRLGNGGTTGSIPAASQVIFGSGTTNTLAFNRMGSTVFPNPIVKGGRANISVEFGQSVTLSGAISGTGEFWISGPGTVVAQANASTTGSGSIVLNKGAILEIGDFSTQTIGSGNFFIGQGGTESTLRYTGASASTNRLTGGTFQGSAVTLEVVNPATTLSLTATLASNGTGLGRTIKKGPGTLAVSGANTYVGGTTVEQGTLLVNNTSGSGTGPGTLEVLIGGVLGGTGTVAPTGANGILVDGTIAPGAGIGTLTVNLAGTSGTLSLTGDGRFDFELGVAGSIDFPGGSDRLTIVGASVNDVLFSNNIIDFGGTGELGWYRLFSTSLDDTTWSGLIVNPSNVITGGLVITGLSSGLTGELVMGDGSMGSEGSIYLHVVPEPGSAPLLMGAVGALLGFRRRRPAS